MKIAILGVRCFPPEMSGIDNQVFEQARRLADRGHEIFLFVAKAKRFEHRNIHVRRVPTVKAEFGDASMSFLTLGMLSVPFLVREIRRNGIEILHTNGPYTSFVGSMVKKLTGVRQVQTIRGTMEDNKGARGRKVVKALGFFERTALKNADMNIALTNYILNRTRAYNRMAIKNSIVIPNGVVVENFKWGDRERVRKEFGLEDRKVLLYVGRLVDIKGLDYLLDAMPAVVRKHKEAVLVLLGDGPIRERLEKKAMELKVEKNVVFAGMRKDVRDFLAACDIFVMPTLHEGFPNALLEVMAAGRPAVISAVTSIPEIVKDKEMGFLVKPKDPRAISNAVLKLLDDWKLRMHMGLRMERESQKYSMDRVVERLEEVYKGLLRK